MTQTKFTPLPSYGSYFQLYKYDRISDESDKDFCHQDHERIWRRQYSRVGVLSIGEG